MRFAVGTDRGLVREINEDSYRIIPESSQTPCVFIIADGMGGHNCGEIASRMAVDFIGDCVEQNMSQLCSSKNMSSEVRGMVENANRAVFESSIARPEANGMGTTLTMAVVIGGRVTVAHVGDSRLYVLHNGVMRQITEDHSYIGELVKKGSLTREEAERHPRKNVITRAIGSSPELEVDMLDIEVENEDILLLCTDGLTNMISEDEIYSVIKDSEPETACAELIETAKKRGGEDNITVIVIKCE